MATTIFTIGHSNHPLDYILSLLGQFEIEMLVDIRRFPFSRKWPHFNRENLAATLKKFGVEYHWFEDLGGRRHKVKGSSSSNLGLQNESFRNYADYMLTNEFQGAINDMLNLAGGRRTAIMCAESLFWRCHRRLVSDFLTANSITVQHIMPSGELRPHSLTRGAKVEGGKVTYPIAQEVLFT